MPDVAAATRNVAASAGSAWLRRCAHGPDHVRVEAVAVERVMVPRRTRRQGVVKVGVPSLAKGAQLLQRTLSADAVCLHAVLLTCLARQTVVTSTIKELEGAWKTAFDCGDCRRSVVVVNPAHSAAVALLNFARARALLSFDWNELSAGVDSVAIRRCSAGGT